MNLFAIHASIWDVVLLLAVGGFAVVYFVLWAADAWKKNRSKR